MNYLIRTWSQVQNDGKNVMTFDTSELTINVLYWSFILILCFILMKPNLFTIVQKKSLWFFYRDVTAFHEVLLTAVVFRHATSRKNAETHPSPMRDVIIKQPLT